LSISIEIQWENKDENKKNCKRKKQTPPTLAHKKKKKQNQKIWGKQNRKVASPKCSVEQKHHYMKI
jgi:hypothetical protein